MKSGDFLRLPMELQGFIIYAVVGVTGLLLLALTHAYWLAASLAVLLFFGGLGLGFITVMEAIGRGKKNGRS